MKDYFVYIMTNRSGTLYISVTNDIARRVKEHRDGLAESFTRRYAITRLVYCESTGDVSTAIEREKQLKGWTRKQKIQLIESLNPHWQDLAADWYESEPDDGTASAGGQILSGAKSDNSLPAPSPKEPTHV